MLLTLDGFPVNKLTDYATPTALLEKLYPSPKNQTPRRSNMQTECGPSHNRRLNILHAFVAALYRPLRVGNLAAKHLQDIYFEGESMPQFTVNHDMYTRNKKCIFQCAICAPFRTFCAYNNIRVKHRQVAHFQFEGFRQMADHQKSSGHHEACRWVEYSVIETTPDYSLKGKTLQRKDSRDSKGQPLMTNWMQRHSLNY